MKITIRPAQSRDCERLMELVRELALYEKAPDEVTVSIEHFRESGFGSNPVWWAFVAEVDQVSGPQIVGMALYYIRYSTWKGQRLYLEDIVVTESWRGKGVGKLLFERVIDECYQKGFNGMMWQALDWNEPAINFYKKYGAHLDGEWLNCSFTTEQVKQIALR